MDSVKKALKVIINKGKLWFHRYIYRINFLEERSWQPKALSRWDSNYLVSNYETDFDDEIEMYEEDSTTNSKHKEISFVSRVSIRKDASTSTEDAYLYECSSPATEEIDHNFSVKEENISVMLMWNEFAMRKNLIPYKPSTMRKSCLDFIQENRNVIARNQLKEAFIHRFESLRESKLLTEDDFLSICSSVTKSSEKRPSKKIRKPKAKKIAEAHVRVTRQSIKRKMEESLTQNIDVPAKKYRACLSATPKKPRV